MIMPRPEKIETVNSIRTKIEKSKGLFLFEYHGLNVEDLSGLRRKVREEKGEIKVLKNSLVKKAISDTPLNSVLSNDFKGPIACAFGYEDVVAVAKVLVEFTKDDVPLKLRLGLLGDKKLSLSEVKQLAKLPSRIQLLSLLVGTLAAPLRGLVTVLSAVPRDLVYVVKAIEDKKNKGEQK